MPNEYINLTFSILDQDYGLSLNQNSLIFDRNHTYGFITLSSQYNSSNIGQTVHLSISMSGPNSKSFVLPSSTIALNFIANYTSDITVSIETSSSSTLVSSISFLMGCSVSGLGYYQILQANCTFLGKENIISNVKNYYQYNSGDICENQFGVTYFEADNLKKTIAFSNIKSNKKYKIYGFCQDFNTNSTTVGNIQFLGKDNGGLLLKMTLYFQDYLSQTNKERVACYLTTYLGVPTNKFYLKILILIIFL